MHQSICTFFFYKVTNKNIKRNILHSVARFLRFLLLFLALIIRAKVKIIMKHKKSERTLVFQVMHAAPECTCMCTNAMQIVKCWWKKKENETKRRRGPGEHYFLMHLFLPFLWDDWRWTQSHLWILRSRAFGVDGKKAGRCW